MGVGTAAGPRHPSKTPKARRRLLCQRCGLDDSREAVTELR